MLHSLSAELQRLRPRVVFLTKLDDVRDRVWLASYLDAGCQRLPHFGLHGCVDEGHVTLLLTMLATPLSPLSLVTHQHAARINDPDHLLDRLTERQTIGQSSHNALADCRRIV